ncbi:MAG TPA: TolC family protein [Drouetiella sp.]
MNRRLLALTGILTISAAPSALSKPGQQFLQDGKDSYTIAAGMPIAPSSVAPSSSQSGGVSTSPSSTTSPSSVTAPTSNVPSLRGPASTSAQDVQHLLTPADGAATTTITPNSSTTGGTVQGTVQYSTGTTPPPPANEGVSLQQALDETLTKGPRAAAIRAQLPIAKAGIVQAAMAPNPSFFMDRGLVAENVRRVGNTATGDPPWKLAFRVLSAKRFYDQNKTDLLTTLWALRASARHAFTDAVVAQETAKTLNDLFELTNRLLNVSTKRFQAGDVPELDVLRARLATSQAQIDLGVGNQRLIRSGQSLNVIMGRNAEAPITVPRLPDFTVSKPSAFQLKAVKPGILPDFSKAVQPLTFYMNLAMENRLELRSLAQQQKVNSANMKGAIANIMPNPQVTYGQSVSGNPPAGPKLKANFFTLNIETPITNMNQGDLAKYKAIGKQLTYEIGSQRNIIQNDVVNAYNNLLVARERIRVYQEHVLADSNEVARLSRRSYEVGQSDINSTLLAQQANIQIRSQYLDAVAQYQSAYTDLEQACGTPLD